MAYSTTQIGRQIEQLAATYLQQHSIQLLTKNFHSKFGEIDLIGYDPTAEQLVFAEVRYRKSTAFGDPAESVNKTKQFKLIAAAKYYLTINPKLNNLSYRFDVVACSGPLNYIKINWIINAFS